MSDIVRSYDIVGDNGHIWSYVIIEHTRGSCDSLFKGHVVDVFAAGSGDTPAECALRIADTLEHQARLIRDAVARG